jgi:suppressor of G2 allele of SKP1
MLPPASTFQLPGNLQLLFLEPTFLYFSISVNITFDLYFGNSESILAASCKVSGLPDQPTFALSNTMSAITLAQQGIEALDNRDYAGALALLDKAINQGTNSPAWLLARAQAHYQLKDYEATLSDTALAYHSAFERANGDTRRHLITAQYRRSTAYFQLGRYADSDCCAKWSMLLAEGRPVSENDGVEKKVDEAGRYTVTYEEGLADKENQPNYGLGGQAGQSPAGLGETGFKREWARAYTWRSQVLARLQALPIDDPGRFVNVTKIPPKPDTKKPEKKAEKKIERAPQASPGRPVEKPPVAPGSVSDEKLKLRSDFYQSNQDVTVSIFSKNIKKEDLVVEFGENHVGSPC